MKKIFILGSTGSIGTSTLNVVRKFSDKFTVVGITTNSNIQLLQKQIEEFHPQTVVIGDEDFATSYQRTQFEIYSGNSGLVEAVKNTEFDILVSSLVGFAGLAPTIEAIKKGKRIALANKETLVVAGEIINQLAKEYNSEIIPVDSEHSAIFQALIGEEKKSINKLIITASGGPFRGKRREDLRNVTIKQALSHPNWKMGNKITIDSATMMNKGLEVIEAKWLFDVDFNKIEVIVHPESIIHSMVEFSDKSIKAQLSLPDMRLPIQYALTYPERFESEFVNTSFSELKNLSFYEPDIETFENLKLAYEVGKSGGNLPCILNAANEIAVESFLSKKISFLEIFELNKKALDSLEYKKIENIETIFECDYLTRQFVKSLIN